MSERKIVWKVYWLWDWEAEENWLNRMARQGWHLDKVGIFRYEFVKGEPGAYQYRLQALEKWPNSDESQDYIAFVEGTGAELVDTITFWAYFRRVSELGAFELFSDTGSRIKHLQRIQAVMIALVPLLVANLINILVQLGRFQDAWPLWLILPFYLIFTPMVIYGLMRTHTKLQYLREKRDLHE